MKEREPLSLQPGDEVDLKQDGYGIVTTFFSANGIVSLPVGESQLYIQPPDMQKAMSVIIFGDADETKALLGFPLLRALNISQIVITERAKNELYKIEFK